MRERVPHPSEAGVEPGAPQERRRRATGASVFPAAISTDAPTSGLIGTLTANAATAIAGQMRYPHASRATTATPVGGQRGVTSLSTSASRKSELGRDVVHRRHRDQLERIPAARRPPHRDHCHSDTGPIRARTQYGAAAARGKSFAATHRDS